MVSFLMEIHGMSFPEAIEELAERGRVPLPKDVAKDLGGGSPEEEARRAAAREKLNLSFKLNRFVAAFYHQLLSQSPGAQAYFAKRGVSDEQIRGFYLGVSSSSWDALTQHMIAKKGSHSDCAGTWPHPAFSEAGSRRSGFFDLFRDRVMFPILDLRGKVVGFGGRSLPGGAQADGPEIHELCGIADLSQRQDRVRACIRRRNMFAKRMKSFWLKATLMSSPFMRRAFKTSSRLVALLSLRIIFCCLSGLPPKSPFCLMVIRPV